jgi:hypothetical protein
MAMLPICDNCLLAEKQSNEIKEENIPFKKIINFPQRKR